jgi:hypothetical protein
LFFLAPREEWYYCVARIIAHFDDNENSVGTGFFVRSDERFFIVTSRHTVDPKYRPIKEKRDAQCVSVTLEYSSFSGTALRSADHKYQQVRIQKPIIVHDRSENDCSAIVVPVDTLSFKYDGWRFWPAYFLTDMLADENHLELRYPGEPIVFIGFPRSSQRIEKEAADAPFEPTLPVLRQGVLALPTRKGINIDGYIGFNYGLLDSFAQSGFSGSPVIAIQRSFAESPFNDASEYRPPRILGIVAGHVRSNEDRNDGVHSGISCFVRASTISKIIEDFKEA